MSAPPKDQALSNLTVSGTLTTAGRQVSNNSTIGTATIANAIVENAVIENADITNLNNDDLGMATVNNGLQFDNLQQFVGFSSGSERGVPSSSNHRNFMINNTILHLTAGLPLPTWTGGRTVTFNNMTSSTTLDIYVTEGYPNAHAPKIIPGGLGVAPGAPSVLWTIPTTPGWNGNFSAFPSGSSVVSGSTLAEFGFNQLWSGAVPPLRETFDVSTVPPGIGTKCNNGPHSLCSEISRQSGFSTQQSNGYNVGIEIIPPTSVILPSATVTCTESDGDSPDSIGYPNDTAFPKQQTIDYVPGMGYTVNFLDPVLSIP